jgi:acetoin utilization deacetylase AcuC-like enzyme
MTTVFFTHPACLAHDTGQGHPERPQRLEAVLLALDEPEFGKLERREAPQAELSHITRVHDKAYASNLLARVPQRGWMALDGDTMMSAGSGEAALRAAGAMIAAVDLVLKNGAANAFCGVRPPGHHAESDMAMGFCLFNNVAIGAAHACAAHGLKRVAIIDFDVHHGNGTEDILAGDERVLMVSFFQHPFYPYTGEAAHADNMVNLPVPAYTKGMAVRELIETHWIPRLETFKPEMIFISAGFDAHREDDLGQLGLVEQDYAWITSRIRDMAKKHAKGRIVSTLEGGYNLDALGRSVEAHVRVLADV